jgi:hypothetical protein
MFKMFGSKKEEFFLEIDDSKKPSKAEAPVAPAKTPSVPAEASEPKAEQPSVAQASKAEAPKAEKPAKATKKDKAKSKEADAPKAEAPAAPPIPAKPKAPEPVVLFAPNNLMPLPNPTRRRPGPNMAAFLDMAKQMKRR